MTPVYIIMDLIRMGRALTLSDRCNDKLPLLLHRILEKIKRVSRSSRSTKSHERAGRSFRGIFQASK